ncbi:MAG: TonB-dependent receptor, partial [Gemmatimonadota bacterium]|nr:TonB-dependent receptor [Gemmatimonadota bacterium]
NAYRNDVLSGALRFTPDARTDARISARWSAGDYHYPTDYSGAVVDHNAEQVDHRFTASVDAGRRVADRVELRATLTSNEYLPRTNDPPDGPADTLGFYGFFSRSVRTRRAADVRVNVQAGPRATFTVGAEASHDRERTTSQSLSQYGNSTDTFEASRHIGSVYAQAVGDATDRVSYVVGVRRDDNSAFGAFTTARAGLAWLVEPGARVRVAAGNAFRAPSFFENFAAGYVTGNPALRPEESRSVEVGGDLTLGDGAVRLAATAYAQRFRNIVQYTGTAPKPGAPNYYNVAAASANGLELEAAWRPMAGLTGTLTYALTDTRATATGFDTTAGASYVRGEQLIRRPRHTLGASLAGTFGDGGSVRLQALRVGERADRDYANYPVAAVTLPAYVKVDCSAVVPTRLPGTALTFRADNLLDARYEEVTGFRAPGLTLFAGVTYHP